MCGKIIGMRYMYSHILTRVRKYTQNGKRKLNAALQNQKNCMVCAIAYARKRKSFRTVLTHCGCAEHEKNCKYLLEKGFALFINID